MKILAALLLTWCVFFGNTLMVGEQENPVMPSEKIPVSLPEISGSAVEIEVKMLSIDDASFYRHTTTWKEIDDIVYETIQGYDNLNPAFIYAIIKKESNFDSRALSWADCRGLMQLHPEYYTGRLHEFGYTSFYDPQGNIAVGCSVWSELLDDYDMETAIRVYGWGAANADKACYQDDMAQYIADVKENMEEWERLYGADYRAGY